MRRTRLNCSYEPKYTETERKRWETKEFWNNPKRYLTGVNELPTSESRYRTILDTRYVDPSTRKCKPVAYISRSGMIEYIDESAKTPEAREVINEEAVNRFKNWLQARKKHSVEDNIYNITHATVHGGYAWSRSEALDIEWTITSALQNGADPQQVVDDYQIVMWLTGLAEKKGYEYPEGAGIDVARATALAHEAINGNKVNSSRSMNSSAQPVTFRVPTTINFTDMDSVDLISAFAGSTVFDRKIDVEGVKLTAKDGEVVVTIPDYVMDWHHNDANYVQRVEDAVKQWLASAGTVKDNTRFANRILRDSINSSRLNSSSNLMFGGLGNGLTVYDKSRKDGDDYLEIAHISTSGMIKYYTDVNDEERTAICKRALLMQKEWLDTYEQDYGSTADAQRRLKEAQKDAYNYGYEYPDDVAINSSRLPVKTQRAIRYCINSARRRASLKSARRLNSGKLFYDEATGEYEEYEYDDEQDAWYQLPDEMYIYKLDLSQFADLVSDGIVSKHEIHEWIDELSEDWGGMPAWTPSKLIDRFEIQDLTKEQYDTWKANFAVEAVRFRDELERRY